MRRRMPVDERRRPAVAIPIALAGSIAMTLAVPLCAAAAPFEGEPRTIGADSARSGGVASTPLIRTAGGRQIAVATPVVRSARGAWYRATAIPDAVEVREGDTVSAIAERHGLRTDDVLRLNDLDWSSIIRPGQVLRLADAPAPPAPATGADYTIVGGDTISAIAGAHGIGIQALLDANGLGWSSIIYPGQKIRIPGAAPAASPAPATPPPPAPAPAPAVTTYAVRAGDTVSAIASAHGTSVDAILSANGLGWSSIIYPGQVLALPGSAPAPTPQSAAAGTALDAEQADNARLIIGIGRQLGISDRGIAIALGTAMQESWLRNLDWGDRDSLGLFQQRPSTGWGTAEQIRDRERSIRVFYGGASDPNGNGTRGLLDIPGWESMSYAGAAQAVQISAYPDRYSRWEQPAYEWLAALG